MIVMVILIVMMMTTTATMTIKIRRKRTRMRRRTIRIRSRMRMMRCRLSSVWAGSPVQNSLFDLLEWFGGRKKIKMFASVDFCAKFQT